MLVNLNDVLKDAQREHYGVGLFNTIDTDMLEAAISAAEELRSPIIIGTAEVLLPYGELSLIAPSVIAAAKRASVPVVVHYDHGLTFERCMEALKLGFTSIMFDGSAGDPAENTYQINEIKKLAGNVPIFGICLGHQLLSLALGARTEKLKYGHRGVNQPVKEVNGARTYITSQNHGYAVVSDSVKKGEISFINANDGTCEGINYPDIKAFSVQFHPEACSGPRDTAFLFDRFIKLMEGK